MTAASCATAVENERAASVTTPAFVWVVMSDGQLASVRLRSTVVTEGGGVLRFPTSTPVLE
jgi:hypothetical protein